MFNLMLTPDLLGSVKKSDIEIVPKSFLIELSSLIGVGYNLSDTQDGLRCLRNENYNLWLLSSPHDKDSGERSKALCFYFHLPKYFVLR